MTTTNLKNRDYGIINNYLSQNDWRVNENSNMGFSLQGLNVHISSDMMAHYWLSEIYTDEIREAHISGDLHIHDLGILACYCMGWDLKDILIKGFKGVSGKISSGPPKHFSSAMGQAVNFFFTLQGESAGAQAMSFDAYTPVIIKRNGIIETVTLKSLFMDYKFYAENIEKSEAILMEKVYNRYSIDDADRRKYIDNRLPTEPILFQKDKIEILSEEGFTPVRIISRHTVSGYNDQLINIETEDGNILRVTNAHPVFLSDGKTKRADEIEIGDELLEKRDQKVDFSESIEMNNDFAYLIGFMIAEGCWGHQTRHIKVSQKEGELKQKIRDILYKLNIPFYDEMNGWDIVISTTRMGRFIRNHMKMEDHSFRKSLPSIIYNLDRRSIGSIISGIIDGDGDLDRDKIVRLHCTSYTLVCQLKKILSDIGIASTVRYSGFTGFHDSYVLRFRVEEKFASLFSSCQKLKDMKYKVSDSPNFSSRVVKIQNAFNSDSYVYDITTDNHKFMVGDIVAHNSNVDTLMSAFIKVDRISYNEVKQIMQEFIFNLNVPTRVGFQSPFSNLSFDLIVPNHLKDEYAIIGGSPADFTYGDCQNEMNIFNRAFCEVMCEGDSEGRVFSFPIPTYNITKEFDPDDTNLDTLWKMTAKFGLPYFSNFINSNLNPEDVRSLCCRLRLNNGDIWRRGGGLFGSNPLTGSSGVVTINLSRLSYLSKDEEEFFVRLSNIMDIAKDSLEMKRKKLDELTEQGLFPYSAYYLRDIKLRFGSCWANHFSTIGIIGMNEACLNMSGFDITFDKSKKFAQDTLKFIQSKLLDYQQETGNLYNLEATPAEGCSYRLAKMDRAEFPDIVTAGTEDAPSYSNSTQLPVNCNLDLFESLNHQDGLQTLYTGGTVFHCFLGEAVDNPEIIKRLVMKIANGYRMPYFTITPTFSICSNHGYLKGRQDQCSLCGERTEVYSRIVGYFRPVKQWNKGKKREFEERKTFVAEESCVPSMVA